MYGNSTFDFGGPERLPPTTAATRIKQKHVPKATYSDPIVISGSSSDDGASCVIPAKKSNPAIKGKKKAIVTSDDEVDTTDGNKHSLPVIGIPEGDYQDDMESRKRKAKKPAAPGRVSKKPVLAINSTRSEKGDERKKPTKGAKKSKNTYVEVSDSDTDKTVKGNVCGIL